MTDGATPGPTGTKRSLFALLGDLPTMVTDLVQREIELVKVEVTTKLKALGKGSGLLVGAVVVVLFMIGVLLTSAVLALSLVMPGWAAALVVAGVPADRRRGPRLDRLPHPQEGDALLPGRLARQPQEGSARHSGNRTERGDR